MTWRWESWRHRMARKGIKTAGFVKKGKVKIPITIKPTYKSHMYPISPQEAKRVLEKLPEKQLVGLKEVSFRPPSRLPFTEQTKAFAQYSDRADRINIYSMPYSNTRNGIRYKKMPEDLDEVHELQKYMDDYVLSHEVAHHHVLDHLKMRKGYSQDGEEYLANKFMKRKMLSS